MIEKIVKLKDIVSNQQNPRFIKSAQYEKLLKSLADFPGMYDARPIVVNKKMKILGGNMRYEAILELGWKEVLVKVATKFTKEQEEEFIIKDNVSHGEWDWDVLANEWDIDMLDAWGVDVSSYTFEPVSDPSFGGGDVTEEDIGGTDIDHKEGKQQNIPVTCPACAKHFYIKV